jgi:hypothetical protein
MTGNKYEAAVTEIRSVLSEWTIPGDTERLAADLVNRLIAKGVIQSTDPEDLQQQHRTGPLEPGRTIVGGESFAGKQVCVICGAVGGILCEDHR